MDKRKIIYYEDELNDEFSVKKITPRRIDASYDYGKSSPWKRFTRFFWYRIVATPLAILYTKIKFRHRIVGAELLLPYRKCGYFIYGNHTQDIGDALIPNMVDKPKSKYVIVHPNNVSIPVLGRIVPSLGGIPLPDDLAAHRNFTATIDRRIKEGHAIVIYPEAHIWPYYTGIRPFPDDSFFYPVKYGTPVFCFTNTYKSRGEGREPQIVTYVDGPFLPDDTLPPRERRRDLRDRVRAKMTERARLSDAEVIKYLKRTPQDEGSEGNQDQHGENE